MKNRRKEPLIFGCLYLDQERAENFLKRSK